MQNASKESLMSARCARITFVWVLIAGATSGAVVAQQVRPRPQGAVSPSIADVNRSTADGATPLHVAVRGGDAARVQALIRAGANVNATTRYGSLTPLALAVQNGDAPMVDILIKAGADPNAVTLEGQTVLMTAARTGNAAAVKRLVQAGADVNIQEKWYGQTALMWAIAQNHVEAASILIEAGADVNARSGTAEAPGKIQGISSKRVSGLTPLLYAAREGSLDAIRLLIDRGANVDLADPDGVSPQLYALMNGHYDAALLLLEKGASPNLVDRTGRGPLFVAVDMHSLEFRYNRPDPELTDTHTSLDVIKTLLAKGANVNQVLTDKIIPPKYFATGNRILTEGSTPFLKAATTSDLEVMKLLHAHGADVRVTNSTGTNALHAAAGVGWRVIYSKGTQEEAIEAITWLLSLNAGFDVNETNALGDTALHGAATRTPDRDANKLLEFLVAGGASLHAKNKRDRTPLDEALGGEVTPENSNGGQRRGPNERSIATLRRLMEQSPPPQALSAAQ